MRVTGDDEIHRVIQTAHDRADRRIGVVDQRVLAIVDEVVRRRTLEAALMDQHDDRLHTEATQLPDGRVDRLRFVAELETRNARRRDDRRRFLEREADEAHAHAIDDLDAECREQRLAGRRHVHVRRQELELRTLERHRRADARTLAGARVRRMTAAPLHAQELRAAFVELMVADCVELEAETIHRLDGAFVVEQRRDQRARADHVTGRDHHVVRVLRLELRDVLREHVDTTGGRRGGEGSGRLQVAVKVIERDHLDGGGRRLRGASGERKGREQRDHATDPTKKGGHHVCGSGSGSNRLAPTHEQARDAADHQQGGSGQRHGCGGEKADRRVGRLRRGLCEQARDRVEARAEQKGAMAEAAAGKRGMEVEIDIQAIGARRHIGRQTE